MTFDTNYGLRLTAEEVTPALAKSLLKKNSFNRPLRKSRVSFYAGQMKRGEWGLNGEPLIIAKDETVLSAQHRLHACIEAGVPFITVVVRGVDRSAFDTIDQGSKRSAGDVLSISGESNYNTLAAATALYHKWLRTGNPYIGTPLHHPSIKQIERHLLDRPELRDVSNWAARTKWCKKFITPSFTAFARLVFLDHNEPKALEFFDQLESGAGLYKNSPILSLRDRMMQSVTAKDALRPVYRAALVFKSFRLFLDDASIKFLRVRTEGKQPEKDFFVLR